MSEIFCIASIREAEVKLQKHVLRFISVDSAAENTSSEAVKQLLQSHSAFSKIAGDRATAMKYE